VPRISPPRIGRETDVDGAIDIFDDAFAAALV